MRVKESVEMDCEKFEPLLLDELYQELDELTSAAVKRHVAGCARCTGILNGLRQTRDRLDEWPPVDVPEDLEAKILAGVREAQKVVPIRGRAARALSLAGSWAMRPQTAMAAVFLLMIGSSAFLLRGNRAAEPSAAVSVTVAGEPASSLAAADHDSLDDKAAAAAHGAGTATTPSPMPAAPAATMMANAERARTGAEADMPKGSVAKKSAPADLEAYGEGSNEAAIGRAAKAEAIVADEPQAQAAVGASPPAAEAKKSADAQDGMAAGMAAYRARNFAEATRAFDAAASGGDANAALWAAKSVRDGSGCGAAVARFHAVAAQAAGTWTGNEALLEEAKCQSTLGQRDAARATLTKLLGVPSHKERAQAALDELDAVAARRQQAAPPAAAAGAAPAAKPTPAKAASEAAPAKRP